MVVARGGAHSIGPRRGRPPMPSEAIDRHVDSAELRHHVWTLREFRDVQFPALEDLRALPFVRPDTERSAKVIEHDRRIRKRSPELRQTSPLRMVEPRIEAETARLQPRHAPPKAAPTEHLRPRNWMRIH